MVIMSHLFSFFFFFFLFQNSHPISHTGRTAIYVRNLYVVMYHDVVASCLQFIQSCTLKYSAYVI